MSMEYANELIVDYWLKPEHFRLLLAILQYLFWQLNRGVLSKVIPVWYDTIWFVMTIEFLTHYRIKT